MSPRNTTTGGVLEAMILPALKRGGYTYLTQHRIGERFGGGKHVADVVAEKGGQKYLLSLKWQQSSGTAEQKVPFEVISLAEAVRAGAFSKAYLILGGTDSAKGSMGWKLRQFYTGGGLKEHLVYADKVDILTLESFVARANQGRL
jgi:hypothetical protein